MWIYNFRHSLKFIFMFTIKIILSTSLASMKERKGYWTSFQFSLFPPPPPLQAIRRNFGYTMLRDWCVSLESRCLNCKKRKHGTQFLLCLLKIKYNLIGIHFSCLYAGVSHVLGLSAGICYFLFFIDWLLSFGKENGMLSTKRFIMAKVHSGWSDGASCPQLRMMTCTKTQIQFTCEHKSYNFVQYSKPVYINLTVTKFKERRLFFKIGDPNKIFSFI